MGSAVAGTGRVTAEQRGSLCVITLERETKLNALSSAMERSLAAALTSDEAAQSRAVVITGGSKVFSAGADVGEMRDLDAESIFAYYRATGGVYEAVAALAQPSVSAIEGYCLGGGLELALATDFRIAGESAVFGLPEVAIGIVPSSGGLFRLVRMVGTARARELVLARQRLSAREAFELGIVTEVVADGAALERAVELAGELSELPPLAQMLARRAIDATAESSRDGALLIEQLAYAALSQRPLADRRHGAGSPAKDQSSTGD